MATQDHVDGSLQAFLYAGAIKVSKPCKGVVDYGNAEIVLRNSLQRAVDLWLADNKNAVVVHLFILALRLSSRTHPSRV
nr:hypothetical protein [Siccirubricoccus sp. G192]